MQNWLRALFMVALFMVAALPPAALAFGVVGWVGVFWASEKEHERITRAALTAPATEFKPASLDLLAGKAGTWGAVGTPDAPLGALAGNLRAHCSNGDFLDVEGYPQKAEVARLALEQCRAFIVRQLVGAVEAAQGLVNPTREALAMECSFHGRHAFDVIVARTKCAVLEHLGFALHASQDFYAHSNWSDVPDRSKVVNLENPPGLARVGRAQWLDPRETSPTFPKGLISGCYGKGCDRRVHHDNLNKDKGTIADDGSATHAGTPRGKGSGTSENFAHAVAAAIDDTKDKWAFFKETVSAVYGDVDGAAILCVVVSDNPRACECRRRAALLRRALEKCDAFVQQGHLSCTVTIDFEEGRKVFMEEAEEVEEDYLLKADQEEWCDVPSAH